jgi:hypothetical protein
MPVMKGQVMPHLWFCSLIIRNARAVGREQTDLRRVTKLLEDAAERFMCKAVFAERTRKVHLIIWPDTPSLLAYSNYADISTNVVLIRPTKIRMATKF